MKVGDLVKSRSSSWSGVVVKIRRHRHVVPHILIFDIESSTFWQRMSDYEVISEGR